MKKTLVFLLTLVLVLSVVSTAIAAPPPKEKPRDCELTADNYVIYVGDEVNLTALTKKHGSSFKVSWGGAEIDNEVTVLLPNDSYETTATFTGKEAGFFVITYTITMSAGKSGVDFVGTDSVTIEVIAKNDQDPTVKNPAAPSIAAHLLKEAGLKPNSNDYKNYVAQVANRMGPGTDFDGIKKENPLYAETVRLFLVSRGALKN